MTPRKELLDAVRASLINEVCSASGRALKVVGAGRAAFKRADGKPVVLHDVLVKVAARSRETDWATAHRRLWHVEMPLLKQLEKDGGVKGPLQVQRHKEEPYFLTLVGDWSRLMWAYPLKQKDQATFTIREDWLPFVEKQAEYVAKRNRTDRGGNRVHTKVGNESWVPLEWWLERKLPMDMLRVFGYMAVAHVPKKYRSKLGASAIWCVHLGLAAESKGWLLWEPSKGVLFDSRDVKFVEGMMYGGWKLETKVCEQMEQITIQLDLTPSVWEEGEEAAAEGGDGEKVQEAPELRW
ncbi:unnamed protein product [Closterium sp. NIES-54]